MKNEKIHSPPAKPTPMMLLNDVTRMFNNIVRNEQDKFNLQPSYRHILFHLAHEDGCTQLQLVGKTRLKAPTISITLQKMEAEGYVERKNNKDDLRQSLVFLTEKGREYQERMFEKILEIDGKVMTGITPEESDILCDILKRMIDNIIDEAGGVRDHGFHHHERHEKDKER